LARRRKNAQLQRIYGTAWRDDKELNAYLNRVEEAEKRDHRKIGREMTCSISKKRPPAKSSGTQKAGRCGAPSRTTSAARSNAATIAK